MYQGEVTIKEIVEAFSNCGAPDRPVSPKQVENQMLDQRLGIVGPNYTSTYSFKMTVQDNIQRSSTNRPKGKPPFYFEGVAYGLYNLADIGLTQANAQIQGLRLERKKKQEAEQRSFLQNKTQSPNPPEVVEFNGRRFVRDYPAATRLKEIYGYTCQVCGCGLATFESVYDDNRGYAEAHHIMPLGAGHGGPDYVSNMLVLCPNDHAAFDLGTMVLKPESLEVYCLELDGELHKKGALFSVDPAHEFDAECLQYVWKLFCRKLVKYGVDISEAERD